MTKVMKTGWAIAVIAGLMASPLAHAEHWLTLSNTTGPVRILLQDIPAEIDNKNITVKCVTNAQGNCVTSGGATPATATLTCSNCTGLRAGGSANLTWSSTLSVVCVGGSTGPSATTWNGAKVSPSGSRAVPLSTAGTYALTLACYGSGPWSGVKTLNVTVAP
jgi:hypothetical protein